MTEPDQPIHDEQVILVSNRGPVTFDTDEQGEQVVIAGGGGLVTALSGLVDLTPVVWISAAISDEDVRLQQDAGETTTRLPDIGMRTSGRFVLVEPEVYDRYYNVIANPMLWFIQHYLWNLSRAPDIRQNELDAWELGYLVANRRFAEVVSQELSRRPDATVMLHDYHLYTAPGVIRQAHPNAFLHFFVHIPWSQPDYWRVVPNHIREAVLEGLLANDIIAFHTARYARNFLLCCEDLLGLRVDYEQRQVQWQGRDVWVRSYPISVNAPAFESIAASPEVLEEEGPIMRRRRAHLIVRVDRADLSKNADPRVPGLRRLPRALPGVRRGDHVPGPAAAHAPGRARVRRVPGGDPRRGLADQHQARQHRLDAHRPARRIEHGPSGGGLQALRRLDGQRDLRRHESGRQGGAARSTSATGS